MIRFSRDAGLGTVPRIRMRLSGQITGPKDTTLSSAIPPPFARQVWRFSAAISHVWPHAATTRGSIVAHVVIYLSLCAPPRILTATSSSLRPGAWSDATGTCDHMPHQPDVEEVM